MTNFRALTLFLLVIANSALFGASKSTRATPCPRNCQMKVCTEEIDPVCAYNSTAITTFSSSCFMSRANCQLAKAGCVEKDWRPLFKGTCQGSSPPPSTVEPLTEPIQVTESTPETTYTYFETSTEQLLDQSTIITEEQSTPSQVEPLTDSYPAPLPPGDP